MNNYNKPKCLLCNNKNLKKIASHEMFKTSILHCSQCNFAFCDPVPSDEFLLDFYSDDYRKDRGMKFSYKYKLKQYKRAWIQFKYLFQYLPKNLINFNVLDFGCNFGALLKYFQEKGANIWGLELNKRALHNVPSSLKERIKDNIKYFFEHSDVKFDLIILSHVLEHFNNPFAEFKKIRLLLKSNALLFVEVPNVPFKHLSYLREKKRFGCHLLWFTPPSLIKMISRAGFTLLEDSLYVYGIKKGFVNWLKKRDFYNDEQKKLKEKLYIRLIEAAIQKMSKLLGYKFMSPKLFAKIYTANCISSEIGGNIQMVFKKNQLRKN